MALPFGGSGEAKVIGVRSDGSLKMQYPADVRMCALQYYRACVKHDLVQAVTALDMSINANVISVKPKPGAKLRPKKPVEKETLEFTYEDKKHRVTCVARSMLESASEGVAPTQSYPETQSYPAVAPTQSYPENPRGGLASASESACSGERPPSPAPPCDPCGPPPPCPALNGEACSQAPVPVGDHVTATNIGFDDSGRTLGSNPGPASPVSEVATPTSMKRMASHLGSPISGEKESKRQCLAVEVGPLIVIDDPESPEIVGESMLCQSQPMLDSQPNEDATQPASFFEELGKLKLELLDMETGVASGGLQEDKSSIDATIDKSSLEMDPYMTDPYMDLLESQACNVDDIGAHLRNLLPSGDHVDRPM